jgi:hypothetical protein
MPYQVTDIEGLLKLMKSLQGDRTQLEFANDIGASPAYISDVYASRREPGEKILSALGVVRQTVYQVPETLAATAAMTSRRRTTNEKAGKASRKKFGK